MNNWSHTGQFYPDCEANEYACWAPIPLSNSSRCTPNSGLCDILGDDLDFIDCPFADDEWNCASEAECENNPDLWFVCENSASSDYLDTSDPRPICIPAEWSCTGGDPFPDCPNNEDISQEFCCGNPGYDGMYRNNIRMYIFYVVFAFWKLIFLVVYMVNVDCIAFALVMAH